MKNIEMRNYNGLANLTAKNEEGFKVFNKATIPAVYFYQLYVSRAYDVLTAAIHRLKKMYALEQLKASSIHLKETPIKKDFLIKKSENISDKKWKEFVELVELSEELYDILFEKEKRFKKNTDEKTLSAILEDVKKLMMRMNHNELLTNKEKAIATECFNHQEIYDFYKEYSKLEFKEDALLLGSLFQKSHIRTINLMTLAHKISEVAANNSNLKIQQVYSVEKVFRANVPFVLIETLDKHYFVSLKTIVVYDHNIYLAKMYTYQELTKLKLTDKVLELIFNEMKNIIVLDNKLLEIKNNSFTSATKLTNFFKIKESLDYTLDYMITTFCNEPVVVVPKGLLLFCKDEVIIMNELETLIIKMNKSSSSDNIIKASKILAIHKSNIEEMYLFYTNC